jgi:hydroxyacylglutathione hydrolase
MIDVRTFTVGPIQENAYVVRASPQATQGLLVDPGEEPERLMRAVEELGVRIEAILITHCHFDHVGAVAPLARATGAPVYCPQVEVAVLADITKWTMPGFGPFEAYRADHTLSGGERLASAGLDVEVLFTPGHSPGHLTYAISPGPSREAALAQAPPVLLSGDVLFQGSVGRVDLPGGDWATLERSIAELMRRFARETLVLPGHMGSTTLGREWDTNPFLHDLRMGTLAPQRTRS